MLAEKIDRWGAEILEQGIEQGIERQKALLRRLAERRFGPAAAERLAMWPGVALTLVVYCLNMVGDALRDLLDPRLRGGGSQAGGVGARSVERATKALQKLERSH